MLRTQISLDQLQYDRLTREARRLGISMSALVRRLVDGYFSPEEPPTDPLEEIKGVAESTGEYIARRHDEFLYGKKR
jgi:hypothetical protein